MKKEVIFMLSEHRKESAQQVSCAVLTVSDTRNEATDKSGMKIKQLLTEAGHKIVDYEVIRDEQDLIRSTVEKLIDNEEVQAVILNGGTGISNRDVTIESIRPLFEKELPGFGELFRYLSFEYDIGTASILSRAICGVSNHRVIFSIPGSTGAVTLAMEKIILKEIGHIVRELNKDRA